MSEQDVNKISENIAESRTLSRANIKTSPCRSTGPSINFLAAAASKFIQEQHIGLI